MRQFACIEIDRNDALILRDVIRPLAKVDPYDAGTVIRFTEKLYAAILKMRTHDLASINIPLEEHEALFINHYVGNEDWGNALALLEQTWFVLYELQHEAVYPRPREKAETVIEQMNR